MRILTLCAMLLSLAMTSAHAEQLLEKPIFDPSSGSYFELHKITKQESPKDYFQALNFQEAVRAATGHTYKGVQGRLATVKSASTHQLIVTQLQPKVDAWIGLRYFCKFHQLRWINGDVHPKGAFTAWDAKWDQSAGAGCVNGGGEADWMPVAYNGTYEGHGQRWIAKGAKKRYSYFIIEYPTGKP